MSNKEPGYVYILTNPSFIKVPYIYNREATRFAVEKSVHKSFYKEPYIAKSSFNIFCP